MNNALNILQLAPRIPYPLNDGGKIGIFNITKHLAHRGHRVTLLTFSTGEDVPEEMQEIAEVVTVHHDTRTKILGIACNLFSKLPYTVSKYQTEKMESSLRALCSERSFDIVHVDHAHLAPYGLIARREFGIPYCLREHNFETTIYERFGEAQGISLLKLYMRMQARRIHRYEIDQLSHADLCVSITDDDAKNILRQVTIPMKIIPAGVDLDAHPVLSREDERENSILILGSLAWQPNVDAVGWFLRDVFPRIKKAAPAASVTIAGMSPPKELLAQQSEHIRFPGFIENLQEIIASAQVLAIPLRIGGGMRIKMLDFFAYGKAVVSTTIGAEGNHAIAGEQYLKADTAEEFASSIIALFRSREKRYELGDAARRFVEERHSWITIAAQFEAAYIETIERVR